MAAGGTPACWSVDAVVVSASDTGGFVCRPLGDWVFLEEGRARQSRNEELDIDVGWTPPDLGDAGHDTLIASRKVTRHQSEPWPDCACWSSFEDRSFKLIS